MSRHLRAVLLLAKRYGLKDTPRYVAQMSNGQIETFARNAPTVWERLLRANQLGNYADQLKSAQAKPTATDSFLLSLAAMADSRRDVEAVIAVMAKGNRISPAHAAGLGTGLPYGAGVALPAFAPSPVSVFAR